MLLTSHPNPNFLSPFPLPEIKEIRLDLWSQHLLKSLSVNQTRGQLMHCPYYWPFSSLDQGAAFPPFLSTANYYFDWQSVHTHKPLAIVTFIVHPAFHTDIPQVLINKQPVYQCESCISSWWDFPMALPGQLIAWLQGVSKLHNQEESFWLFIHTLTDFVGNFWKPIYPYNHKSPNLRPAYAPLLPLTPNHPLHIHLWYPVNSKQASSLTGILLLRMLWISDSSAGQFSKSTTTWNVFGWSLFCSSIPFLLIHLTQP